MFSLTSYEQEQIVKCCAAVLRAHSTKDKAVFTDATVEFGMAKAQLQSQIARLFAVVDAIESKEAGDGQETEPPF